LNIFLSGAWLGLSAAAPIGPVNVEMARRTLRNGFHAGFALGCGAVSADLTYAILASLSLGAIVSRPAVKWLVTVAGIGLIFWLGIQSLRAAARHLRADPLAQPPMPPAEPGLTHQAALLTQHSSGTFGAYGTGLLMTLLNPFTLVFWFVAVPGAGAITKDPRHDLPMICAGIFIGTIGWVIFFAGVLGWLGRWRRPWWLAAADGAGGTMLLALTVWMAWQLTKG